MGGYIERISAEIADIILREGIDYQPGSVYLRQLFHGELSTTE